MPKFGDKAVIDGEFQMSSEERRQYSLDNPGARQTLTTFSLDRVSMSRIRDSFMQLAAGNVENVHRWLNEVGERNPKEAVELFMELAQFVLPKVKATVVANVGDKPLREMSMEELVRVANEGN